MTVKTAAEVPSDVQKRCSLELYGMSLSKRNCIESNSDVPANQVEMRREVSDYISVHCCIVTVHFALGHRQRCCGIPPTVLQEIFIPQLIARGLPFNQKLHRLSKTVH